VADPLYSKTVAYVLIYVAHPFPAIDMSAEFASATSALLCRSDVKNHVCPQPCPAVLPLEKEN